MAYATQAAESASAQLSSNSHLIKMELAAAVGAVDGAAYAITPFHGQHHRLLQTPSSNLTTLCCC
jgi:hypothetical protein